jgi:hypothetical protein
MSHSKLTVLALRVKSYSEITSLVRQAAVAAGNRRIKEFIGTADDRLQLLQRFDLSANEVFIHQYPCVLSDVADREQKNGIAYVFNRRLIFEAKDSLNLLNQRLFKIVFFFEKTTFKQSQNAKTFSLKCRRETGETYRLNFHDQRSCTSVCSSILDAQEVISKEKVQMHNIVKLWLPADEGAGGQSSKTFKVHADDTIRALLEQLREKMGIQEEEIMNVVIEGPIPFQPAPDELVIFLHSFSLLLTCILC